MFSDGAFRMEDIVEAAYQGGLDMVGITDHYETSKTGLHVKKTELESYFKSIEDLRLEYKGKIKIKAGLEIDSCPERCDFSGFPEWAYDHLDFLLFEYINMPEYNGLPLERFIDLRKDIPVNTGLAHTDIASTFSRIHPMLLIKILQDNNIFLELTGGRRNRITDPASGTKQNPWRGYMPWLKDAVHGGVRLSVGTDCHNSLKDVIDIDEPYEFLVSSNLINSLIFSNEK
jgi:histidinol phosphatase-like PHP family hydrolase